MTDLAAAVERVWPGRGARFEPLGGGITNHNVKVEFDGEVYVLRVVGQSTDLLGIDRHVELEATKAAAAAGIGPEVVAFVEPEGWLVTRFIAGETPSLERMREPEMLARVARGAARVPRRAGDRRRVRLVPRRRGVPGDGARPRRERCPRCTSWAHEIATQIERRRAGAPPSPATTTS